MRHHRIHVQIRFVAELPIVEIDGHRQRHEYKNEYCVRYYRSVVDKKHPVYCQMHSGQFALISVEIRFFFYFNKPIQEGKEKRN